MPKKASTKKTQKKVVEYRAPIVTLLGHVDHGKTSILDRIRASSVQTGEVGGITQSISVYSIENNGKQITFVDTPGHEAFNLMRSRGGQVADIVLLIVAADDSVKPQTKESIEIIKSTKTPCIVVINKVDISGVDIEKVKRDLSAEGLIVESMGGDIPSVEVSAKTGKGISDLVDMINLVAEVNGLAPKQPAEGTLGEAHVLESYKDKSRGNVSTVVVTAGGFKRGEYLAYFAKDPSVEKIKGFINEFGKPIDKIMQGSGGQVLGLPVLLELGEKAYCVADGKVDVSKLFSKKTEVKSAAAVGDAVELDTDQNALLLALLQGNSPAQTEQKTLKVILKAYTQGKLDAIKKSLDVLNKDAHVLDVLFAGVGDINAGDIEYAANSGAIVIGFEVKLDRSTKDLAAKNKVLVRIYDLIYSLVDELEDVALGLQSPDEEEEIIGKAQVRKIFTLSDGSTVLGLRVESGEVKSGYMCRVTRGEDEIGIGKIKTMRCGKDKIDKAVVSAECGVVLDGHMDALEGDKLECFKVVKL